MKYIACFQFLSIFVECRDAGIAKFWWISGKTTKGITGQFGVVIKIYVFLRKICNIDSRKEGGVNGPWDFCFRKFIKIWQSGCPHRYAIVDNCSGLSQIVQPNIVMEEVHLSVNKPEPPINILYKCLSTFPICSNFAPASVIFPNDKSTGQFSPKADSFSWGAVVLIKITLEHVRKKLDLWCMIYVYFQKTQQCDTYDDWFSISGMALKKSLYDWPRDVASVLSKNPNLCECFKIPRINNTEDKLYGFIYRWKWQAQILGKDQSWRN